MKLAILAAGVDVRWEIAQQIDIEATPGKAAEGDAACRARAERASRLAARQGHINQRPGPVRQPK